MKDKLKKNYQRKLNHLIKTVNKELETDDLFNGRFVFHIMATELEKFEDKSGGILHTIIRGYDKKTGYYKDFRYEFAPYFKWLNNLIWQKVNDFIIDDVRLWKQNDDPYKDNTLYYNQKVPIKIWNLKDNPYNFYIAYKVKD